MRILYIKFNLWQLLSFILIIFATLPSFAQTDINSDFYFFDDNQVPSSFTYKNCTTTVSNGILITNTAPANSSWSALWTINVNKDLKDSPFLCFSYKVGTPVVGRQIGLAITVVVNNIENAISNGTSWRLVPRLDASTSTWHKVKIDLSSLLTAWKVGNPGSVYKMLGQIKIVLGTTSATLDYSGDLSFDSISVGNYLRIKSSSLSTNNPNQLTMLLSRPVENLASSNDFTFYSNGVINPNNGFSQLTDSTLLFNFSNPLVTARATNASYSYSALSFKIVDKFNSQNILEPVVNESIDLTNYFTQSYWPYWGGYNQFDISNINAQPWLKTDGIIKGWDWSLPPSVKPSPSGFYNVYRSLNFTDNNIASAPSIHFPCNPLLSHWVKWSDIEPKQGQFQFAALAQRIAQATAKGYKSEIRFLFCRKDYAPAWVNSRTDLSLMADPTYLSPTYDPTNPIFHQLYLAVVDAFGKSGLAANSDVVSIYVGWRSSSNGDEGICPVNGDFGDTDVLTITPTEAIGKERLDHWAAATAGNTYKVIMGGESDYGFTLGFGRRNGFIEHYLYEIPWASLGQSVNGNGYLSVDESVPVIKNKLLNSDENEEYDTSYINSYGNPTAYPYRFFSSSLRLLQMRCNKTLMPIALIPDLYAYLGNALGRTMNDSPDAWCWLRESSLRGIGSVKNFERWLTQRDQVGYTTSPYLRIEHPINEWMCYPDQQYDYIARKGSKIGFELDSSFYSNAAAHPIAIKITYLDIPNAQFTLAYYDANQIQQYKTILTTGTDSIMTATFFVNAYFFNSKGVYDFEVQSSDDASLQVPVILVRVVKNDIVIPTTENESTVNNPSKISIYPNPVLDALNLRTNLKGHITIVNVFGTNCYDSDYDGQKAIDCSHLISGSYFLKIISNKEVSILRFIKK